MQIIDTRKVDCRDCHRCLRTCPVNAVELLNGHARVLDERCILCGKCVLECPQRAKRSASQLPEIRRAIASGRRVVLSLGSSYLGWFGEWTPEALFARLYRLGFETVTETAEGAMAVAMLYRRLYAAAEKTLIASNCPVVVNLIRKYYPQLTEYLAPVVSPMTAHGMLLRRRFGADAFIVFAGPCIGKFEDERPRDAVDAVLTFAQLRQWMNETRGGTAAEATRPHPDAPAIGRLFPLAGGVLKALQNLDRLSVDVIAVDGIEKCMEVFESLSAGEIAPRFIEAFSCVGGCIGGPAGGGLQPLPLRRLQMLERIRALPDAPLAEAAAEAPDFSCRYRPTPVRLAFPAEEEIQAVLRRTGKFTRADEKNCGACGYASCREKAVAVCQGVAEIESCMPYMRSKAESFASVIVEHVPFGIVALDRKMYIQEFNPELARMFGQQLEMQRGMNLGAYIDCGAFAEALRSGSKVIGKRVDYPEYGIVTEQMILPVPKNALVIGIIADITAAERAADAWETVKEETVAKATEIIHQQMKVAQEIAGLLGETTADTKSALLELMQVLQKRGDG